MAWDGDEIAGVVQNWIWPDENEQLGVERGWLEHISVRRPWRRHGLGRAITAERCAGCAAAGMTDAMLGVDAENPTGALGLYEGARVRGRTSAGSTYRGSPATDLRSRRARRRRAVASWTRTPLEDPIMRSYLIVANQTLTSRSLTDAITARLADGPVRTHVVVPAQPGRRPPHLGRGRASRSVAQERLDEVVARLREMGAEADGEVGDRDPVHGRRATRCAAARSTRSSCRRCRRGCPAGSARTSRAGCAIRSVPVTVVTQA